MDCDRTWGDAPAQFLVASNLSSEGVVILNANKDWQLAEHPQYDATYYPQSLK